MADEIVQNVLRSWDLKELITTFQSNNYKHNNNNYQNYQNFEKRLVYSLFYFFFVIPICNAVW